MCGLGNDFVVIDARATPLLLEPGRVRAIADRHTGVGCDQLIVIEPVGSGGAQAFMRIYNADGGEVGACGNGARCVGALLLDESGLDRVTIDTAAGQLEAEPAAGGFIRVDLGEARTDWQAIPLAREMDTLHLTLSAGPFNDAVGVNMGNPHAVFFVDDAESAPLGEFGTVLEHDRLFPERANIGAAQVLGLGGIRLRVWERGVGLTQACGTGACAALVAAARRGLTERAARIELDGGTLEIEWAADNHVWMSGPIATSFEGMIDVTVLP